MNSGPFDVIIVGGGTFGLALAQDLYFRSKRFDRGLGSAPRMYSNLLISVSLFWKQDRSLSLSMCKTFRVLGCFLPVPTSLIL